jgi:hypothetical protein
VVRVASYLGNWRVTVRAVDGSGAPTGTIITSVTLTAADVPTTSSPPLTVPFVAAPYFQAGTQFAIAINPVPPVAGAGQVKGFWTTKSGNGYSAGDAYFSSDGAHFFTASFFDLRFTTYVDPAITPEPSALPGALVACAGLPRRRFKSRALPPRRPIRQELPCGSCNL